MYLVTSSTLYKKKKSKSVKCKIYYNKNIVEKLQLENEFNIYDHLCFMEFNCLIILKINFIEIFIKIKKLYKILSSLIKLGKSFLSFSVFDLSIRQVTHTGVYHRNKFTSTIFCY